MYASNITLDVLTAAADSTGVAIDCTPLNKKGTRYRVKVNSAPPAEAYTASGRRKRGDAGNAPYQRISPPHPWGNTRRVHAVCWHGFRDFFRACFESCPDAVFRTAFDTWKGSADFEARYRESGTRNIGSNMFPMYACEACVCPDSGLAN